MGRLSNTPKDLLHARNTPPASFLLFQCQEVPQVASDGFRFQYNVVLSGGVLSPLDSKTSEAKVENIVEKGNNKKKVSSESLALI